jgi:hypothetical protein
MNQIRSAYINEIYKNHNYIITNMGELCEDLILYLTEKTYINKTNKCRSCDNAGKNGCNWSDYTCYCASSCGHLDCLVYAH